MKNSNLAVFPAAAVAAAALLPSWTPNRRNLTMALIGGTRAVTDEMRYPGTYSLAVNIGGDKDVADFVSRASSGFFHGLVGLAAVEVGRLVLRDKMLAAAVLGGVYYLADHKLDALMLQEMQMKEDREAHADATFDAMDDADDAATGTLPGTPFATEAAAGTDTTVI